MPQTTKIDNKRKGPPPPSINFHCDFKVPTLQDRTKALGSFPGAPHAEASRRDMLTSRGDYGHGDRPSLTSRSSVPLAAFEDLNNPQLYVPFGGHSETRQAVPDPCNELDWLAQVPEPGQTFDDYVCSLTSRSGRLRPIVNPKGEEICLLPIVAEIQAPWPDFGPPLAELVDYTQAFFDRTVHVLSPTIVSKTADTHIYSIQFPSPGRGGRRKIVGRSDSRTGRTQLQVTSVLEEIARFRRDNSPPELSNSFCVVGITMQDLYESPKDLFIAGLASGANKVAVFSFFRYHPHLQMHPLQFHHFGFGSKSNSYPYYKDHNQNPTGLDPCPKDWKDLTARAAADYLGRSGKLLTHEICHLYGIDHCIYARCVMNGTGHLVEDFAAPAHLCGVCLRKLQWRLGFRVSKRYELLADAFGAMGMKKEETWARQQMNGCQKAETCSHRDDPPSDFDDQ